MKNVLVIGSTGQIGSELTMKIRGLHPEGNVVAGYIPGAEPKGILLESGPAELADVRNAAQLAAIVDKYHIDTIYNLAALLSAVAERKPLLAWDIQMNGHAIECRINAEDPYTFVPSPGKVTAWHLPGGPGIRIDTHVFTGYTVPPYYDSLVAKLIAHGHTREQALARMSIALSEFAVEGIKTNIRLHRDIMADEKVRQGGVSIHYLEEKLKSLHS